MKTRVAANGVLITGFCLEYMKDRNGSAAYKRAGYKPKNDDVAKANASRLLTNANVGVPQRIAELEAEYATKIGFEIEDTLNKYLSIVNADPAELTALFRGACRYCHGINHNYHWRTAREYAEGIRKHLCAPDAVKVHALKPSDDGGYGYTKKAAICVAQENHTHNRHKVFVASKVGIRPKMIRNGPKPFFNFTNMLQLCTLNRIIVFVVVIHTPVSCSKHYT
jgi:hypothetical protein